MARVFDRQLAGTRVRVAVLNGYTGLGMPVAEAVGQGRPGRGEPRAESDFVQECRGTRDT